MKYFRKDIIKVQAVVSLYIHIIMFIIIGCFYCCLLLLNLNCDNLVEGLAEVSVPIAGS